MKASSGRAGGERGFALILALLSLVVLTLLGLTLATTTTTELQIASNYRWSKQAYYNAEAGIEAAVAVLSTTGLTEFGDPATVPVAGVLDPVRTVPWMPGAVALPGGLATSGLDYYPVTAIPNCDERNGGIGYGRVIQVPRTGLRLEEQSEVFGPGSAGIPGTFTAWIRREVQVQDDGRFLDNPDNRVAILTVMGTAPKTGPLTALDRTRQAVRVVEVLVGMAAPGKSCSDVSPTSGQVGRGPLNANYAGCVDLRDGGVAILGNMFDGAGRGTLAKK